MEWTGLIDDHPPKAKASADITHVCMLLEYTVHGGGSRPESRRAGQDKQSKKRACESRLV